MQFDRDDVIAAAHSDAVICRASMQSSWQALVRVIEGVYRTAYVEGLGMQGDPVDDAPPADWRTQTNRRGLAIAEGLAGVERARSDEVETVLERIYYKGLSAGLNGSAAELNDYHPANVTHRLEETRRRLDQADTGEQPVSWEYRAYLHWDLRLEARVAHWTGRLSVAEIHAAAGIRDYLGLDLLAGDDGLTVPKPANGPELSETRQPPHTRRAEPAQDAEQTKQTMQTRQAGNGERWSSAGEVHQTEQSVTLRVRNDADRVTVDPQRPGTRWRSVHTAINGYGPGKSVRLPPVHISNHGFVDFHGHTISTNVFRHWLDALNVNLFDAEPAVTPDRDRIYLDVTAWEDEPGGLGYGPGRWVEAAFGRPTDENRETLPSAYVNDGVVDLGMDYTMPSTAFRAWIDELTTQLDLDPDSGPDDDTELHYTGDDLAVRYPDQLEQADNARVLAHLGKGAANAQPTGATRPQDMQPERWNAALERLRLQGHEIEELTNTDPGLADSVSSANSAGSGSAYRLLSPNAEFGGTDEENTKQEPAPAWPESSRRPHDAATDHDRSEAGQLAHIWQAEHHAQLAQAVQAEAVESHAAAGPHEHSGDESATVLRTASSDEAERSVSGQAGMSGSAQTTEMRNRDDDVSAAPDPQQAQVSIAAKVAAAAEPTDPAAATPKSTSSHALAQSTREQVAETREGNSTTPDTAREDDQRAQLYDEAEAAIKRAQLAVAELRRQEAHTARSEAAQQTQAEHNRSQADHTARAAERDHYDNSADHDSADAPTVLDRSGTR